MMFRAFAVLLATTLLAACGSESPTEPRAAGVAGRYELVEVNGEPVPYPYLDQVIESGTLELRADMSFTQSVTRSVVVDGERRSGTSAYSGVYAVRGGFVHLMYAESGGELAARLNEGRVFVPGGQLAYVFERR